MTAKWMCATATAALLIATAGVHAQTQDERKQEPSATQQQNPSGETRSQQQTPSTGEKQGGQAAPRGDSAGSSKADQAPSDSAQGRSGSGTKQSGAPKKEPAPRSSQSKDDAAGDKAATRKDSKDDESRGKSTASEAKSKDTTQARDKDDGDQRASGQSREQKSTRDSDRQGRADAKTGEAGESIQVTERERTTIQKSIDVQKARVNIDVDVNIGAPVPRSVSLYPLPAAIIDINPRWRNYRYVVVRDEIVIINPQTYVVVEVIPVSGSRQAQASGAARASVRLSAQQRQRILTYARAECQTVLAEPGFELGVGIRIPERIELCPFEDVIVQEVGVVQPYRFFVVQNQVVLVDPATHTIVEVVR